MTAQSSFYDVDTVKTMTYIAEHSAPDAVYAATSQMMSTIRLTTGRRIVGHQHSADDGLRLTLQQVSHLSVPQHTLCRCPSQFHSLWFVLDRNIESITSG